MSTIISSRGEVAGWDHSDSGQIVPARTLSGHMLGYWMSSGVPGVKGVQKGSIITEQYSIIPPTTPLFNLALLDHFDDIGWKISQKTLAANTSLVLNKGKGFVSDAQRRAVFAKMGYRRGISSGRLRTPKAYRLVKLPEAPTFISSQKSNVEANQKAIAEMQQAATKGNLAYLKAHPATPSPKVQEYKKALIQAVIEHKKKEDEEGQFDPKQVEYYDELEKKSAYEHGEAPPSKSFGPGTWVPGQLPEEMPEPPSPTKILDAKEYDFPHGAKAVKAMYEMAKIGDKKSIEDFDAVSHAAFVDKYKKDLLNHFNVIIPAYKALIEKSSHLPKETTKTLPSPMDFYTHEDEVNSTVTTQAVKDLYKMAKAGDIEAIKSQDFGSGANGILGKYKAALLKHFGVDASGIGLPTPPTYGASNNKIAAKDLYELAVKGAHEEIVKHNTPLAVQPYKDFLLKALNKNKEQAEPKSKGIIESMLGGLASLIGLGGGSATPSSPQIVPQQVTHTGELPNPDKVKYIKDLPGSTYPQLVEDESGNKWVKKQGTSSNAGHIRNEAETDAAYRAAGIAVPDTGVVETASGPVKFGKYIEGAQTLGAWEQGKSKYEIDQMHKEISKGMVADALFANWDVIGKSKDNILIVNGKPVRVDNGGGLKYRAQGSLKGNKFGSEVKDLDLLRDKDWQSKNGNGNTNAAEVFKNVNNIDIQNQIKSILTKKQAILDVIKDSETKEILAKRFDHLQSLIKASLAPPQQSISQGQSSKPASVTPGTPSHPLHSGDGLAKHVKMNMPGHIKLTDADLKKISGLNPNGVNADTLLVHKASINAVKFPKQKADALEKEKAIKDILSKVAKPGTKIAHPKGYISLKSISKVYEGSKESEGSEGSISYTQATTEESGKSKWTNVPEHLVKYIPSIESNSSVTLPSYKDYTPQEKADHNLWVSSLTSHQQYAIGEWKGSAKYIRVAYAKSVIEGTELAGNAKHFMDALSKAPSRDGVYYRGIGQGKYAEQQVADIKKMGVGGTWSDVSPHGMSPNPFIGAEKFGDESNGVMFRIVKKDARSIQKVGSGYSTTGPTSEQEHIGMPGTKYRIAGIYDNVKVSGPGLSSKTMKHIIDLVEI